MTVKGNNGESYDVTGSGQGLYNTIAGSIGALGAISGGNGILGGLFGGNNRTTCSENEPITRYDAQQMINLAAKDAEIANLKADTATDKKMLEVYAQLNKVDNQTRDRIDAMAKELLDKITVERETRLIAEKEQAVFNQSMIGSTSTMSQQIKQLNDIVSGITTSVVPSRKVCDTGCGCNA